MTTINVTDMNRAYRLFRAALASDHEAYTAIYQEAEHQGRLPQLVTPLASLTSTYIRETAQLTDNPVETIARAIDWADRVSTVLIAGEMHGLDLGGPADE